MERGRYGLKSIIGIFFLTAFLLTIQPHKAGAQSEPFIGEIVMFAGNFAPRGWALCQGQSLQISDNQALFSILGTIYGGDGRTTFALPDLRGRVPLQQGNGPGLSNRLLGSRGGEETHTLSTAEMPSHNHSIGVVLKANSVEGDSAVPAGNYLAKSGDGRPDFSSAADIEMAGGAAQATAAYTGGNLKHNNMQPFLSVNFIIALQGVYPSRN